MKKYKIGNNYKYINENLLSTIGVLESWKVNIRRESTTDTGLRLPQYGALAAIQAHWSVCSDAATIVMPTGTGKTETMIMTIVSERINKSIIVVPSNLLREQTVNKLSTFGILKDIGVVDKKSISPTVVLLKSVPKSDEEFDELLNNSNIVVVTMALVNKLNQEQCTKLEEFAELLIVDEAHHIMAASWLKFKNKFLKKRILQFTATPFRNDGKKIDGKIIYNYPLHKAQKEGYFQKINFFPIYEFNEKKGDLAIAKKAIECLERDISNKKEHIVLVRTTKIARAEYLYENVYKKYYSQYNPVLIVSKNISAKEKKERMEHLKTLQSRIVVCVDMFGEGIDIPNLKIAAIHDKYQSLPITLQFIGRFARTKSGLGDASVVTNIANETLKESLSELYSQDSDWNSLLADMSEKAIGREVTLQELEKGFQGNGIDGISIKQLLPKVSMQAFKVKKDNPKWDNWKNIFKEEKCKYYFNEEKNILIIIEAAESKLEWSSYREISNLNWELYLIYYNKEKRVAFINSSVKGSASKIADSIFPENDKVKGECIFRCLYGINRLMLGTVGLNSAINGPIRYKMFAGIDIAQGINEAQKSTSTKSNLFGIGYNGNGKISIGCSYKGTVWSRWVESIDFWIDWCNQIIDKIFDTSIDVEKILEGVLIPKEISKIPEITPYRIDWPIAMLVQRLSKEGITLNAQKTRFIDVSDWCTGKKKNQTDDNNESGKIVVNKKEEELSESNHNRSKIIRGYSGLVPTKFRELTASQIKKYREKNIDTMMCSLKETILLDPESLTDLIKTIIAQERFEYLKDIPELLKKYPQFIPYFIDVIIKKGSILDCDSKEIIKHAFIEWFSDEAPEYIRIYIIRLLSSDVINDKECLLNLFRNLKRNSGEYIGRAILEALDGKLTRGEAIELRDYFYRADNWERRQILKLVQESIPETECRPFMKDIAIYTDDVFLNWMKGFYKKKREN